MIHRHRGNRRKQNFQKAIRKAEIAERLYGHPAISPHVFNKGKVHCSCPMCAAKTNASINKSNGAVCRVEIPTNKGTTYYFIKGSRVSGTNHRLGKKNYKASDIKKVTSMNDQLMMLGEIECLPI